MSDNIIHVDGASAVSDENDVLYHLRVSEYIIVPHRRPAL